MILSKKYGVDMVRFTHTNNAVICASKNGWDGELQSILNVILIINFYLFRIT